MRNEALEQAARLLVEQLLRTRKDELFVITDDTQSAPEVTRAILDAAAAAGAQPLAGRVPAPRPPGRGRRDRPGASRPPAGRNSGPGGHMGGAQRQMAAVLRSLLPRQENQPQAASYVSHGCQRGDADSLRRPDQLSRHAAVLGKATG